MEREEIEKCPVSITDWSTKDWLNEIYRNYATLMAIATGAAAQSGHIKLRDVVLADKMARTLVKISNLVEKERKQSRAQPGGSAEPSSRYGKREGSQISRDHL